ncbi:MAG TPA: RluA family pseudouridine synthase [Candidatus Paceibacterota bacterium]|nr:RluA family pseudouridine synthase [Candidatus Paceibacterota bacterium]HRZ29227.1 RluA family pseudouridine synthase [Candidatus Paceibacterota bacterium]
MNVGDDPLRPGIVHRLDKDTSGLMIIVKNQLAFKSFKIKFQNHKVQKIYMALIYGKLKNKSGTINTPIARSKNKFNHRKITLDNSGKEAITDYEVIKEFEKTSLIKAYPKTGRTHQIRVHLSSMSNYIIGDNEYGSSRINKKYNITRQFLHSTELIFDYKREKYHFISKLPKDLST